LALRGCCALKILHGLKTDQALLAHITFLSMMLIDQFLRSSCINVVSVVSRASSGNSSVYLWTPARSVGHASIFDVLDSAHFQHQLYNFTQPSTALQRRVNTLLIFCCDIAGLCNDASTRCRTSTVTPMTSPLLMNDVAALSVVDRYSYSLGVRGTITV